MDSKRTSPFYNPLDDYDDGPKKNLFSNRVNSSDNQGNSDYYSNQEIRTPYLPGRTSKLWNHTTTRPYSSDNQASSSYASRTFLDEPKPFEPFKDFVQKVKVEERVDFNSHDDRVEAISDVFSDAEDNNSLLNKLHTLSFHTPTSNSEQTSKKSPTTSFLTKPSFVLEPNYEDPEETGYPQPAYSHEKLFSEVSTDENKYLDVNYPDKFLETNYPEPKFEATFEEPVNYDMTTKYNAVKMGKYPDLNSVTTSDSVKDTSTHSLLNMGMPTRVDNADALKEKEPEKTLPLSITLPTVPDTNNPFDPPSTTLTPLENKQDYFRERKTLPTLSHAKDTHGDHTTEHKPINLFAKDYPPDLTSYTSHVDYNPFSAFSIKNSSGSETITEADARKLRSVLLSSRHSEDKLIKYFTEAICITNNHTMTQVIQFLIGFIKDNHKARQFGVRLLLCALSFHPEEFISAFRVEYLNALFTPLIDDTIGVYFLKLLLSYKSTFNSKSEVNSSIPCSLNADGFLEYCDTVPAATSSSDKDRFRNGKIESLYILKILLERNRVDSVFDLKNSMLREQLCMIWYEMPKTIPNVNMVEVLLHWVNSNDDLETKKYPFLLLERIRDTYQFPKGHMLLLSHFFLFTLKQKANVNSHLEYLITLVSSESGESDSSNPTQRSIYRTPGPRGETYRTSTVRTGLRATFRDMPGFSDDMGFGGDILALVLYNILYNFSEKDLLDLWCMLCVIPWKVTGPNSPFSKLFSTTLTTILKVSSVNDSYSTGFKEKKIRLDILENCLRICLVRCSCPINSLNSLLQTTLLLNPTRQNEDPNRSEGKDGLNRPETVKEDNMVVACLYRNGMILNSLCTFLWKCHFLWTRIKEGVNVEVVIVVTELYKILSNFTTTKPLDINYDYNTAEMCIDVDRFFKNYEVSGLWTKISKFIPQINLGHYFRDTYVSQTAERYPTPLQEDYQIQYGVPYSNRGREPEYEEFTEMAWDPEPRTEVKVEEPESEEPRTVGLKNLGNSCYLNSLLQALYNTKFFVYNLMNFHDHNPDNEMVSSLVNLFVKMRNTDKRSVSPKKLFKLVSTNLSSSQQDVTEAIRYISEAIDPNLELWKSVFAGLVVRRIKCLRCGSLSDNEETMYDFSLSLTEAKTVQKMLDNFCNVETLSGENKYFCLKCNKDVKAHMWNIIASPPSHLIVILNRNYWSYNETQKVLKRVKIDSDLFITGFQYKLYGSIIHSGGSAESGHYYYIGCDSENLSNWYKADDSVIKSSHQKEVDKISRDSSNTHVPYVLFYRCLQAPQTPKF